MNYSITPREKTMEQDKWSIIEEALEEAQYLISDEIQCVMNEDIYDDYQNVLDKIDSALLIIREHLSNL